ncbi:hypothetical protein ACFL6U_28010 [Planctomycetota bacterium]
METLGQRKLLELQKENNCTDCPCKCCETDLENPEGIRYYRGAEVVECRDNKDCRGLCPHIYPFDSGLDFCRCPVRLRIAQGDEVCARNR